MAVGWGKLSEFGLLPLSLQQVSLQTIASESPTCLSVMYNKTTQLCAGSDREGKGNGPFSIIEKSNRFSLLLTRHLQW